MGDGCCDSTTRGAEQVPSDLQPCERWTCQKTTICSAKARDSNQTSRPLRIAESIDTPPFVQPAPPSNRTTNMIAPDPSPHVTGETSVPSDPTPPVGRISTIDMSAHSLCVAGKVSDPSPTGVILVSSREVTYSQVS